MLLGNCEDAKLYTPQYTQGGEETGEVISRRVRNVNDSRGTGIKVGRGIRREFGLASSVRQHVLTSKQKKRLRNAPFREKTSWGKDAVAEDEVRLRWQTPKTGKSVDASGVLHREGKEGVKSAKSP